MYVQFLCYTLKHTLQHGLSCSFLEFHTCVQWNMVIYTSFVCSSTPKCSTNMPNPNLPFLDNSLRTIISSLISIGVGSSVEARETKLPQPE